MDIISSISIDFVTIRLAFTFILIYKINRIVVRILQDIESPVTTTNKYEFLTVVIVHILLPSWFSPCRTSAITALSANIKATYLDSSCFVAFYTNFK